MLALGLASLVPAVALAEADEPSETIVVTGRGGGADGSSFESRHRLTLEDVDALAASSADDILRQLPSVQVPVNSRGEAIAFVRNAGERQVAVFYEGAAINVPWDNRLDLSLFPGALIGSVRMAAGPLATHYGVNAIGALSLSPRNSSHGSLALGTGNLVAAEGLLTLGPVSLGGSYTARDGEALAAGAAVPFSQTHPDLRTNTDRRLASAFGRVGGEVGGFDLSLTALHVWGEKGIAPEGNRASGARFWRYPDIGHTLVVASARGAVGPATDLSTTVWHQRFGQTIENHASSAYDQITAQQTDRDRTWGGRALLTHHAGAVTVVGSFNYLGSTHRQRDVRYTAGSPPAVLPAELTYSQRNWSVGGELEVDLSPVLRAELGIGYDKVDYVRTGDKPPVSDAEDWTGRVGLILEASGSLRLRAAAGRKMRAPTMRERFGEAINRFLTNPDLRPERITTYEVGAEWHADQGRAYATAFHQDLKDTIDQRTVGGLRQCINLAGSTVWGIEAGGEWNLLETLRLSASGTWSQVRAKGVPAGQLNRIAEKPSLEARVGLDYSTARFSAGLEIEHVRGAYSADPAGVLVPLENSTSLNARLAYTLTQASPKVTLFVNADNLTDAFIEPQLGLPAPGRTFRVGLRLD